VSDQNQKTKGLLGRLFGGNGETTKDTSPEATPTDRDTVAPSKESQQGEPHQPASDNAAAPSHDATPPTKQSWFKRLTTGLSKTSNQLSDGITGLFTKKKLDLEQLEDLEDILIQADLGVETAIRITSALSKGRFEKGITADDIRAVLAQEVAQVLEPVAKPLLVNADHHPHVILVVGVNGTGKTTTIGKLAAKFRDDGKTVMLAAGDTFRAAAVEQLKVWGQRTGSPVIASATGADASGLAFDALTAARQSKADVLLLDTAGRLQNKQALMEELEKIVRVLKKVDATAPHSVLLVLDATTGQNAMQQVEVFTQRVGVTGLIMTKLDGTARGGIIVSISAKHAIPVHAIGVGEGIDDLQPFNAEEFASAIAQTNASPLANLEHNEH